MNSRPKVEFSFANRERGAVLVVSLIFLLVITLIAVGSTRDTVLEERMAGNTRDRNIAFQSAESGVREAENFIEAITSLGNFGSTAGLYGLTDVEPKFFDDTTWQDTSQHVIANSAYGAYEAPRYTLKHVTTDSTAGGALNMSGYGDNKGSGDVTIFRITVRGTGGNVDSAEVILRSQYGRVF
ncbi:MAG: PilX N-terminal domain-containing pilus assembly protein [Pseudomonadota bacterium]